MSLIGLSCLPTDCKIDPPPPLSLTCVAARSSSESLQMGHFVGREHTTGRRGDDIRQRSLLLPIRGTKGRGEGHDLALPLDHGAVGQGGPQRGSEVLDHHAAPQLPAGPRDRQVEAAEPSELSELRAVLSELEGACGRAG